MELCGRRATTWRNHVLRHEGHPLWSKGLQWPVCWRLKSYAAAPGVNNSFVMPINNCALHGSHQELGGDIRMLTAKNIRPMTAKPANTLNIATPPNVSRTAPPIAGPMKLPIIEND